VALNTLADVVVVMMTASARSGLTRNPNCFNDCGRARGCSSQASAFRWRSRDGRAS